MIYDNWKISVCLSVLLVIGATVAAADPPLVVAHRGLGPAGDLPENTIPALVRAIELGADVVEMDVRLTADGVPVLHHDPTLDRTTDCRGPVDEMTAAELGSCRVTIDSAKWRNPIRVPTLAEALAAVAGGAGVIVEIKPVPETEIERTVDAVLSVCETYGPASVRFASFSEEILAAIEARDPHWTTGLHPGGRSTRDAILLAERLGLDGVHARYEQIAPADARLARDLGIYLGAGGVNHAIYLVRLAVFRPDLVYTDHPGPIADAVAQLSWDEWTDDDDDAGAFRLYAGSDDAMSVIPDGDLVGCSDAP